MFRIPPIPDVAALTLVAVAVIVVFNFCIPASVDFALFSICDRATSIRLDDAMA
ncbi:MAG: hypothetical protein ACRDBQ_16740 [Shewanella sp.]